MEDVVKLENFRGAESKLYRKDWFEMPAIYKNRIPKNYRIKELDFYFRKKRTSYEAKLLVKAREAGVRVPIIYEIDLENTTIIMEFIDGEILKTLLPKLNMQQRKIICNKIGENVGLLHKNRIVHGDLTTSNIIKVKNKDQLAFIDFGLGFISDRLEDFGIDIYLLERAFRSTHADFFPEAWEEILNGYMKTSPYKDKIKGKIAEIVARGRYSERV